MKVQKTKFVIINYMLDHFTTAARKSCVKYSYEVAEDFTEVVCIAKPYDIEVLKSIWNHIKEKYDLVYSTPHASVMDLITRPQFTPQINL